MLISFWIPIDILEGIPQVGPGLAMVGSAKMRKLEHENMTGGNCRSRAHIFARL